MSRLSCAGAHKVSFNLNLADLCVTGFWFCQSTQRITEVNVDGDQTVCVFCHSPRVKWNPPLQDYVAPCPAQEAKAA